MHAHSDTIDRLPHALLLFGLCVALRHGATFREEMKVTSGQCSRWLNMNSGINALNN